MPLLATNKDTLRSYEILEELEAGIKLVGAEVKSAKAKNISLKGSYATIHGGDLWLRQCRIGPYKHAPADAFDPTRERRLLVHKRELNSLVGKLHAEGLTLLPLSVYTHRGLVKVKLGLGKGLKQHDKRALIKKRETDRQIRGMLKRR